MPIGRKSCPRRLWLSVCGGGGGGGLGLGLEPRLRAPELPRLTAREQEVLQWMAQGLSTKEIARQMHISPETVKDHLLRLYEKLEARNRVEALERARSLGLLSV
ncbi:two component LuxR family transcriptional regulator [Meiothermus ruber H328]|nr:two component LuxR family transcriptional regulator [Meiothermus ruber H328]